MENIGSPIAISPRRPSPLQLIGHCLRRLHARLFPKPSNLELHAARELRLAGVYDKDADYNGMLGNAVMDLVRAHCKHGHSGGSHHRVMELFAIVANGKCLLPLTNDPEEWHSIADMQGGEPGWQNLRQSSCFSEDGGKTYYDIDDKENYNPEVVDGVETGWRRSKGRAHFKMHTSAPSE